MRFDKYFACLLLFASMFFGYLAPSFAQDDGVQFQNSVTCRRIYGWERNLTVRDPNLAKWHWDPIVANTYNRRVITTAPPNPQSPQSPQNPQTAGPENLAPPSSVYKRSHYVKPVQIPLPVVNHGQLSVVNNSNSDLNGKVLTRPHKNDIATAPKPTATYGGDYHSGSSVSGNLARTNVNGQVLHISGKRAACGPEAPKFF